MTHEQSLRLKLGARRLNHLQSVKIGIAGAGGLGSNLAAHLVRCGFRHLKLVDYDRVEPSNLDRQFYFADQVGMLKVDALKQNLLRIHLQLEIETIAQKIEPGDGAKLFGHCHIIAECLDRAESKSMLVAAMLPLGKLIVAASGLGGWGETDRIQVHRLRKNLVIVGDLTSDISSAPALSPRVNIVAAKQADVILDHVINQMGVNPSHQM
jgi:sulfur carrier protein ThiS adenylyltransferase